MLQLRVNIYLNDWCYLNARINECRCLFPHVYITFKYLCLSLCLSLSLWLQMFSHEPLTATQLSQLFVTRAYERVQAWSAYPYMTPHTYKRDEPEMVLAPFLYYLNAFENTCACMECAAIAARNIAHLAAVHWMSGSEWRHLKQICICSFGTACRQSSDSPENVKSDQHFDIFFAQSTHNNFIKHFHTRTAPYWSRWIFSLFWAGQTGSGMHWL